MRWSVTAQLYEVVNFPEQFNHIDAVGLVVPASDSRLQQIIRSNMTAAIFIEGEGPMGCRELL